MKIVSQSPYLSIVQPAGTVRVSDIPKYRSDAVSFGVQNPLDMQLVESLNRKQQIEKHYPSEIQKLLEQLASWEIPIP